MYKIKLRLIFFFCLLGLTGFSQDFVDECIILYYPFEGDAANAISDKYLGELLYPELVNGKSDEPQSAYNFNGYTDYIKVNNNDPVIESQLFSITAWAKMDGQGGGINQTNPLFVQRDNSANPNTVTSLIALFIEYGPENKTGFLLRSNSPNIQAPIRAETESPAYGEWHFYAAVKDVDSIHLYIDGQLMDSKAFPEENIFDESIDKVELGRHYYENSGRGYFNGTIDEFKVYNCALPSEKINDLYNEELTHINISQNDKKLLSVYPNPATDNINLINESNQSLNVQLYNSESKAIMNFSFNTQKNINIEHLSPGFYYIIARNSKDIQVIKLSTIKK